MNVTDWATAGDMNYTVVLNGFVWLASMLYYVVYARKVFSGPRSTIAEGEAPSSSGTDGYEKETETGKREKSEI